jgi:predicted secreted protein
MTANNHTTEFVFLGISIITVLLSAGCLWFSSPQQPACTINQTPGEVIVIDETMDNMVICTNVGNSITFRMPLWDRVGGVWSLSNSSGLQVSEGIRYMPDRNMPGFGTLEWNVTAIAPGVQTLNAKCIQGVVDSGHEKLISTQNLSFVVRQGPQ